MERDGDEHRLLCQESYVNLFKIYRTLVFTPFLVGKARIENLRIRTIPAQ